YYLTPHATTHTIYYHSLHDALPICYSLGSIIARSRTSHASVDPTSLRMCYQGVSTPPSREERSMDGRIERACAVSSSDRRRSSPDRKSTRLNSSHLVISYDVFCLKK